VKLLSTLLLVRIVFAAGAEQPDLYPQIREIIQAAERDSLQIAMLDDRSRPGEWAGHLYARAGYLSEAARAYSRTSTVPFALFKARIIYGDLAGTEKGIASLARPEQRLHAQLSVADVLWRMGKSDKAQDFVTAARKTVVNVGDPTLQARLITLIEQTAEYLKEEPPNHLSAHPVPPHRLDPQESAFPPFPITTDGFADRTVKEVDQQASANRELMTEIYHRIAAQDREGLMHIMQTAVTPFQKTLAIASIEHLLIQVSQPEMAEQYAITIPEVNVECRLAKAEAVNSAGAVWLRVGNADRARTDFEAARKLAESARELPFGQASVFVSIATAQAKGGLIASSEESLRAAEQIARQMPIRPAVSLRENQTPISHHYRDEAYREILAGAIRVHNLGMARQIAELWKAIDKRSSGEIVNAWLRADKPEEAMAFARSIENTPERVKTQLSLAQMLLDQAGAPDI